MEVLFRSDRDEFGESLSELTVFGHSVISAPLHVTSPTRCVEAEAVLVDGSSNLAGARETCQRLGVWQPSAAVLVVLPVEAFDVVCPSWQVDDIISTTASPAEIHARLCLRLAQRRQHHSGAVTFGDLVIRPDSYTAYLADRELDLTLTEFKLLNHLVGHPGRAFTRASLLNEIWGGVGGRRKVDVHVQRLRAKLGAEHESIVDTVRGVGYMTPLAPQKHWALAN
ncbi:winged helix-turn-helix domain-containing protein [Mycolicibacter minnesotensis]